MTDLITRLETTDEPDRKLDLFVYALQSGRADIGIEQMAGETAEQTEFTAEHVKAPNYTASLDAALTMLPPTALPAVILRRAIFECGAATDHNDAFIRRLPAFLTAACLRGLGEPDA